MNLPDCPIPTQKYDRIVMAHGGGGRMTSRLIERFSIRPFKTNGSNKLMTERH